MKVIIPFILGAFAFVQSKVQIVYTDVSRDSVIRGSYNLDLNKDGITDFVIRDSIKALGTCRNGQLRSAIELTVTPSGANNAVIGDGSGYALALDYNSEIVADSLWADTSQVMFDQRSPCFSIVSGYWLLQIPLSVSPDDRYLGLKFIVNNNTYYGWARLSFGTTSATKLKAYAYNSSASQSITAGQGFPQTTPAIQWQKSLGGSNYDHANSIQQTNDGGFIVCGISGSNDGDVSGNHGVDDYWLVKLNSNGAIHWQKSLGGSSYEGGGVSSNIAGMSIGIVQTSDSGYIMAGSTRSNDGDVSGNHVDPDTLYGTPVDDYWIVKLNSSGTIQWQKCLGGRGDDRAKSIQQTSDGGYIVAGYSGSNGGDVSGHHGVDLFSYPDYWVVKLDSSGNIVWQKSLGGSSDDGATSIQQTSDGGYIVAGYSGSNDGDVSGNHGYEDYWIVKLNSTGNIQWQKNLGGSESDVAYSIQQTADGGYIVAGMSNSIDGDVSGNHSYSNGPDYWVVKLDTIGNIQWQKSLGGSNYDIATSIRQTIDGNYIVAGYTFSHDGDVSGIHDEANGWDDWVVKLNNDGNIAWQKCLGGTPNDIANSIKQTNDGGYIVAGWSNSDDYDVSGNHGYEDFWVAKLAPDIVLPLHLISFTGILENNTTKLNWQTAGEINTADFIIERSNNAINFLSIGKVNAQTTSAITNLYKFTDDAPLQGINCYRLKMEDKDGKFSYSNIVKINFTNNNANTITIAPNPFSNSTTISFSISQSQKVSIQVFSEDGRLIKTITNTYIQPGTHHFKWDATNDKRGKVTPGIYYLKLNTGDHSETKKLSVIK